MVATDFGQQRGDRQVIRVRRRLGPVLLRAGRGFVAVPVAHRGRHAGPGVRIEAMDISRFYVLMVGPLGHVVRGRLPPLPATVPSGLPNAATTSSPSEPPTMEASIGTCTKAARCVSSLDILGITDTSTWSPARSIKSVLFAIQSLLTEKP
ncbi:hypothetical protein MTO96_043846 [Rhipicephalus appendiculatus]